MTVAPVKQRAPTESKPPRMGVLARLPLFVALEGRRAMIAGGTAAAAWKAELLSAAGAVIEVFAPEPGMEMLALAADPPRGPIAVHRRAWATQDFFAAAIAVGACEDDAEASRLATAARAAGVPVNIIDRPKFCDFSFGAIVNRSPLVIGISTDGAAPVFGQAIRSKLEALIPAGFARWAKLAQLWRADVQSSGLSFNGRRRFWQLFTERALREPEAHLQSSDYDVLLNATKAEAEIANKGSVTLVGAGPGDPELLTLRAVRALQSADVILYDDLVAPEILDFARREAKKLLVGKTGHGPSCRQSEINDLMTGLAKSGRRVVRLKGGDPMIFGRAGEEIAACQKAGVTFEVVPGITAAQGAASRLGVSLTQRQEARRVQYITAHGVGGALPSDVDYRSIADPATTTVIYMPVGTLHKLVDRAIVAGLDPMTPAVAVARATRPGEARIVSTVVDLPARLAGASLCGPVLVMIGQTFGMLMALERASPARRSRAVQD